MKTYCLQPNKVWCHFDRAFSSLTTSPGNASNAEVTAPTKKPRMKTNKAWDFLFFLFVGYANQVHRKRPRISTQIPM